MAEPNRNNKEQKFKWSIVTYCAAIGAAVGGTTAYRLNGGILGAITLGAVGGFIGAVIGTGLDRLHKIIKNIKIK